MSGKVKSRLLFLSINAIVVFIFLQMGLYLAHQLGGWNLKWGLFEYCLNTLRKSTPEHRVLEFLFYGLIVYTVVTLFLRLTKQIFLTRKINRTIQTRKHHAATKQLNDQYSSWGTEIIVVKEPSFVALAMGWFRTKILISTYVLEQFTQQEVRAILLHEWHHCKNKDPLKLFLITMYTDSIRYLPVIHGLAQGYKIWRELLADRFAMDRMGSSYDLGSVLLKLTDQVKQHPTVGVTFAHAAINYRIQQVIEPLRPIRFPFFQRKSAMLSVVFVILLMSFLLEGCA